MLLRILLAFTLFYHLTNARKDYNDMVYFPEEALPNKGGVIPANINLTEIRGTTLYEKYVEKIIAGGVTKLTLAVNKALLQGRNSHSDNIVFAPLSIACALALIHLGSNGKTYNEIANILGFASGLDVQTKSVQVHEQFGRMLVKLEATGGFNLGQQISFAHGIFVQENYPIRKLYKDTARQLYESDIRHVDYESKPAEAQKVINQWVSSRTKGKITDILAETPTSSTKVIIASALYFKALWEHPFFEGSTTRRPFYSNGRQQPSTAHVEMMANGGKFPYYKDNNLQCEIMGFPYKGNTSTMYVVMPFGSDTVKLKNLESTLTADSLESLADNAKHTPAVVLFPKMKMESSIDLKGPLKTLGLKSLFDPAEANLALLSAGENTPPLSAQNAPEAFPAQPSNGNQLKTAPVASIQINSTISEHIGQNHVESPKIESIDRVLIFSRSLMASSIEHKNYQNNLVSRINTGNFESLDKLRQTINQQSTDNNFQNPGLFADKVIHKVYMDITETGTEAAASTSVSLSRDGNRVTFRVDTPFLFFIRHEDTKTILFWGSVNTPTPNF